MFTNAKLLIFSLLVISILNMPLPTNYFIARAKKSRNSFSKSYFYNGYINSTNNNTNNYTNNNTKYDNQTRNNSKYDNNTDYNNKTEPKNNTDNTTTNVKILYSYGDLYEYKREQILHLYVNVPIIPYLLTNITFITRNRSRLYRPQMNCSYEKYYEYGKVSSLKCYIDLSYMSKGDYFIHYFFYDRQRFDDQYTLITIKGDEKKEENKTANFELIGIFSRGYEYSINQNITLFFNNNATNLKLISYLNISNSRNVCFPVPLECLFKEINNSVFCLADYSLVPADYYKVQNLIYNYSMLYPSYNIWFDVYNKTKPKPVEEDIKLLYFSGEAYKNISHLHLTFNKNVSPHDLDFYLTDYHKSYLTFPMYHSYCRAYNTSIECDFDFSVIPKGIYNIDYYYKQKKYETNITIEVKEREILSENDLVEVYHNFKRYRDNQIAFFSFHGRNPSKNLAYIVLNDGYSKINVLQTFECITNNFDYDESQYDLKCKLNLTYVGEGKYSVSEYYINNQHYYTKNKINIIVQ